MATLTHREITGPSLRERVVEVTRHLQETGALTDVDAANRTTDAVLAEVQQWLRERAAAHTVQVARAALRIAARELGLPEERD